MTSKKKILGIISSIIFATVFISLLYVKVIPITGLIQNYQQNNSGHNSPLSLLHSSTTNNPQLKLIQTIPLPNVNGRIDHMDIDLQHQKLFVAELENNSVDVIDLTTGKRIQSITNGLQEPQGVLFVPEFNKVFISNGGNGIVKIFDTNSFKPLNDIKFSEDADNIRYDDNTKLVYVGYGNGGIGIINTKDNKIIANINLPGHPESFQIEKKGKDNNNQLFVNIPYSNLITVIDKNKKSISNNQLLSNYRGNFPMALDDANHRLFIGTRDPPKIVVLDTQSGKIISSLDISRDPDDIFYDSINKHIYVSAGEGFINIIEQKDKDHYYMLDNVATSPGSRTSFLVQEINRLYLAVPKHNNHNAEIRVYEIEK